MNDAEQDQAEALDDDELPDEYPPERPLGAGTYGTTPAEERNDEPLAERVSREEPDFGDPARRSVDTGDLDAELVEPEQGAGPDETAEAEASLVDANPELGSSATASEQTGAPPAEGEAVHLVDGPDDGG